MKIITREEAIYTLQDLINSALFSDEIEKDLQDIADCIHAETLGRHEWGGEREKIGQLYVAKREDLITDEWVAECEATDKKYRFTPSPFEKDELED